MDIWGLPRSACIGGTNYEINTDFRDVLEIIGYLTDSSRPEMLRWEIAVGLFFEGDIPDKHKPEAMKYLAEFISYDSQNQKPGPKLIDWAQDAPMIIGDVNKVAGTEIRAVKHLHWWTFLSYFYGIGEGQLSTVVSIRNKRKKGKKLEKWEEQYYRENRSKIDFCKKETAEDKAAKDYFNKWL